MQTWATQLAVPGRTGTRIPQAGVEPTNHQLSACRHDGTVLEIICRCGAVLKVPCKTDAGEIVRAIRVALEVLPHDSAVGAAVAS